MTAESQSRIKVSYQSTKNLANSVERSRFLEETDNKDLTFKFQYWDIASCGSTSRDLLAYAKAHHQIKYDLESPTSEDWDAGKVPTSFSYLPMLKIVGPQQQEVDISENMVIDMYLAERFGLMGDNKWEHLTIQSFYSNIQYLRERCFSELAYVPQDKLRKTRDLFLTITLRKFLEDHAFHLRENGNNGHYIGNKLTLADIHLANIIHYFGTLPWAKLVIEDHFKKYEPVWKVKETVDKEPSLAAWRQTEQYRTYERNSVKWYADRVVPGDEPRED